MPTSRTLVSSFLIVLAILALPAAGRAAFPGENGPIVFDGYEAGGELRQVFSVEPDGSDLRRLTDPATGRDNSDPAIGPDSREIVYTAFDETLPEGTGPLQLRMADVDGSGDRWITSAAEPSSMASFFPFENGIVFVRDRGGEDEAMWRYTTEQTMFPVLIDGCCFYGPTISPQLTASAWVDDEGLTLKLLLGPDGPEVIAPEALTGMGRPAWTPASDRVAFVSGPVMDGQTVEMPAGIHSMDSEGDRRLEVATSEQGFPASPAYSPDGTSLAFVLPDGEPGIHVKNLISGETDVIDVSPAEISTIDWGNHEIDPPPPPPPPECRMRFTKARFFVFRKKPVYRLVARYWSADPGVVAMSFHQRRADGSRGRLLGTIIKEFDSEGRFRVGKRVGRKMARSLRRSEHGFVADFEIAERPDLCGVSASLDLTRLQRVKNQYVWFAK